MREGRRTRRLGDWGTEGEAYYDAGDPAKREKTKAREQKRGQSNTLAFSKRAAGRFRMLRLGGGMGIITRGKTSLV
jgi:hypothetical protein